MDFRKSFIETLIKLAGEDDKVCLIICDVGFKYAEEFEKRFPQRFWNLGVTEFSSMAEVTGMALEGMKPYIYSMRNFVLFRPAEAVRNCVVKHNANVKILGVSGSEGYKFLGFSHNMIHPTEDIDFCKNIGLDYFIPESINEVKNITEDTYKSEKSVYIRL